MSWTPSLLTNQKESQTIRYTLTDAQGNVVGQATTAETKADFVIENVNKWHGRKNPYLYNAKVELIENETVLDNVSAAFGCRSYEIDPERGFILNGEEYPLRGVSRHQDRWGKGNALSKEDHKEDMELICEVGATTIRLAHYQHDQYFYDLCMSSSEENKVSGVTKVTPPFWLKFPGGHFPFRGFSRAMADKIGRTHFT